MHPVIRILCFLSLIATLAHANLPFILFVDGIFLLFVLSSPRNIFVFTWRLVRRMRWFWLSIILLYSFMTPGGGESLRIGVLEFSLGGFWLGFERCLALLSILLYFALLIHTTSVTQLQGALYWLLQPLCRWGLPVQSLSIRIALTMQMIDTLQSRWSSSDSKKALTSWRDIPDRVERLIQEVFQQAESNPMHSELTLDTSAPNHWQWVLLTLLILSLVSIRILSARYF